MALSFAGAIFGVMPEAESCVGTGPYDWDSCMFCETGSRCLYDTSRGWTACENVVTSQCKCCISEFDCQKKADVTDGTACGGHDAPAEEY